MDGFRLFGKTKNNSLKEKEALISKPKSRIVDDANQNLSAASSTTTDTANRSFTDLGLSDFLVKTLNSVSIYQPTEIQRNCIPPILRGLNVIGSAKTGSGKTAAFALPILQKLSEDPYGIFALVLTPTRELAFQIAEQFRVLGEHIHLRQSVIVGGLDMMTQALELSKRPHVVVATPGRFRDHLNSCSDAVFLKKLQFLVLDEADRLLTDTFADDLKIILDALPKKRQTLLFSATITNSIEQLQNEKTFVFKVNERFDTVQKLEQTFVMTPTISRDANLVWLLRQAVEKKMSVIVFTGKCYTCELVRVLLREMEIDTTALHSKMSQQHRISSLARFRSGLVSILLTTDVGSRGLDIPSVQLVINYDVPSCATDYIHRIGRTARAGRGGKAISLITEIDIDVTLNIEKKIGKKLLPETVPEKEINEILYQVNEAKRIAAMHLRDIKFGEKAKINREKRKLRDEDSSATGKKVAI